ncbi:tyrosine-type recombinase/integrase [Ruminococcus albus]|uniref:Site-specific recombinase XerD n=1 Tax=Ruminococcus albus TaxID=1264 RepID=A0A1I1S7Y0_RUMAL|nr:tyrosine-type recombinase/integrase [Ruminococcus albus]SFD42507.1 Site-specific recombinase XerD [Ruminococcus albus]
MMNIAFKSVLAPYIQGLLDQKRALGFKYDNEAYILARFDKYWLETNGDSDDVTMESLEGWTRLLPTEGKSSQAGRISVIRQLTLYMNGLGKISYVPIDVIRYSRPVVHVLSPEEVADLFRVIDGYVPKKQSTEVTRMAYGYRVIFRLILATGLRRSEAVCLRLDDINWKNGSITIYNAKGHKDRVVFMSGDLTKVMRKYTSDNLRLMDTEWVFPSFDPARHFSGGALSIRFRQFWKETVYAPSCAKPPTIHSLRHTYVVMRMNAWISEGIDLNVMLPYLSRALGHKSSNETFYYYHQVKETFRIIREKDCLAYEIFPEVRVR